MISRFVLRDSCNGFNFMCLGQGDFYSKVEARIGPPVGGDAMNGVSNGGVSSRLELTLCQMVFIGVFLSDVG